jgi:8-oxo-dGTP diphosphatase
MNTHTYEYARPAFTADVALVAGSDASPHILLIRRGAEPFIGRWALPGGFVDEGERPLDAARRELAEETGIVFDGTLHNTGTFGDPGRDPRGWTVTALYSARLGEGLPEATGGDDAAEAAWFPVASLAFDHGDLVAAALARLGVA